MKPDEIDSQIADWNARIALARENLDSFRKLPEYDRVTRNPSSAQSAVKLGTITDQLKELELSLDAIVEVIDRAADLRGKLPRTMPQVKLIDEITALLDGPSIVMGAVQTPADRRELLRPVEATQSITPRQLLQSMLESFRTLRDDVLEVDHQISQDAEQSAAAQRDLVRAKSEMEKLVQSHTRANQLDAERCEKVDLEDARVAFSSVNETAIDSLRLQFKKLDAIVAGGKLDDFQSRLELLSCEIRERLSNEEQRIGAAESALNARRDLRGLLDALMAKARDRGRADEPELSALANHAVELLHRRPTPMKQARAIVTAYQTRLL